MRWALRAIELLWRKLALHRGASTGACSRAIRTRSRVSASHRVRVTRTNPAALGGHDDVIMLSVPGGVACDARVHGFSTDGFEQKAASPQAQRNRKPADDLGELNYESSFATSIQGNLCYIVNPVARYALNS